MKSLYIVLTLTLFICVSCFNLEEEPILQVNPTTDISAHIKNERIFATALVSVNPNVLITGTIPVYFEFTGELAIYNTLSGNIIDINSFTGGGLSQVYTVSADTATHERFVVIASGTIDAYADIENDGDLSNDKRISSGDFYREEHYLISDLIPVSAIAGQEIIIEGL